MWTLIQAAFAQTKATPSPTGPEGVPDPSTVGDAVLPQDAAAKALKAAETSGELPLGDAPTDAPVAEVPSALEQMLPTVDSGAASTATPGPIFQTSEDLFANTSRIVQEAAALPDSPEMLEAGQSTLTQLLALPLFTIGNVEFTPGRLLLTAVTLVLTFAISKLVRRATVRAFNMRGVTDEGRIGVTNRLVHYTILLLGFSLSLEAMGVHLSALFAAGAIFAVGLGFAMQNIVQNFVSGVILLIERSIKPMDVLKIDGEIVRVEQMGIRATVVRTRDEEEIIVPNGVLVGSAVKNYTKGDRNYRVRAPVGVHYKSDMNRVEQALLQAARAMPGVHHTKEPVALLLEFGDNSVNWELSIWTTDPWSVLVIRSQLNKLIWDTFKEYGIEIAFPQLDVHLDKAVIDALRGSPKAGE